MFGLFVLEASLALALTNRLSVKLVNQIFTVQFLDKLDSEVAGCYSKVGSVLPRLLFDLLGRFIDLFSSLQTTYPARVRRTLMELNRSVCIDMPEAGVPWFHEKYCQEQMHTSACTYAVNQQN